VGGMQRYKFSSLPSIISPLIVFVIARKVACLELQLLYKDEVKGNTCGEAGAVIHIL